MQNKHVVLNADNKKGVVPSTWESEGGELGQGPGQPVFPSETLSQKTEKGY